MVILTAVMLILVLIGLFVIYNKLTAGRCENSNHLVGKVVIVTGGSSGIGFETAMDLAQREARVIIANRNEKNGMAARAKIIAESGNNDVDYRCLDLASIKSVRKFAEDIIRSEERLDVLINNAGVLSRVHEITEDGFPAVIQTNYFGPFLLTNLMLPLLKRTSKSRIVNVSSILYKFGQIDLDDINMQRKSWITKYFAYASTKLYLMLMTVELDRRLRDSDVTVNVLHPGAVITNILLENENFVKKLARLFLKSARMGAQTIIHLAVSPELTDVSGCYFEDCKIVKMNNKATDSHIARNLWEKTAQLVKLE